MSRRSRTPRLLSRAHCRTADLEAKPRHHQRPVIGNDGFQGADFIGVLFSRSCEFFRLAVSFSV